MKRFFGLYIKTIFDIGFRRFFLRIFQEIKRIFYIFIPAKLLFYLFKLDRNIPNLRNELKILKFNNKYKKIQKNENFEISLIKFHFLNQSELLKIPFFWNNESWPRLWQFNLHYFDWAREFLDNFISNKNVGHEKLLLEILIDDWINSNPAFKGDGWHSYTISLRVRNWIYIFRFFPELINKKRIKSLWNQILWLYLNAELANGGNHLLENLITLLVATLQFDGGKSKEIYDWSLDKIKSELDEQILDDGGHFERSASYHFLMLDRLVELGFIFQEIKNERPYWLVNKIVIMTNWAQKVYLKNKVVPSFNDSAFDICADFNKILSFSYSYIYKTKYKFQDLRLLFSRSVFKDQRIFIRPKVKKKSPYITDLPDTGWTILRIEDRWALIFKNGISCPKYLPAHTHSDLLSFDLYYKSKPVIVEAGTSTYDDIHFRKFERSGSAHNIIQFSKVNSSYQKSNWIEPVDVWGKFRAARKAAIISRDYGYQKDKLWVNGSHDGFNSIGVNHKREIRINEIGPYILKVLILDYIKTKNNINWRLCFHLAPGQNKNIFKNTITKIKKQIKANYHWEKTYYSKYFGKRFERDSLYIYGRIDPGCKLIKSEILISLM